MKIVASLEIEQDSSRFANIDRLIQTITEHIIKAVIEEKDCAMSAAGGPKNPEALDMVSAYDDIIESVEVRKWGGA